MTKKQIIEYLVKTYGELVEAKNNALNDSQDAETEDEREYYYQFYRSYRSECVLMQKIAFDMFGIDIVSAWLNCR